MPSSAVVAQVTVNHLVAGSNPASAANFMKTLNCKLCNRFMGEIEKGKIRNESVVLCNECWDRSNIAIQMAELARSQKKDFDVPDFMKGIFGGTNKEP